MEKIRDIHIMEEETFEILQAVFGLLRLQGMWPKSVKQLTSTSFQLKVSLVFIVYSLNSFGCIFHAVYTTRSSAIVAAAVGFYYMIYVFMRNATEVYNLTKALSNFEEFGRPDSVDDVNRKLNWLTKGLYAYATCGATCYGLWQLYEKDKCELRSVIYVKHKICGLMMPTWMPFDLYEPSRFYTYFCVQLVTCALFCNSMILVFAYMFGTVEIFLVRVQHFKLKLALTFTIEDSYDRKMHLINCIKYHIHLLELGARIDILLGKIAVMHMTFTSVIISLIGLQFLMQPSLGCIIHVGGWLFVLFGTCLAGERLISGTSDLAFHIYSMQWYNGDVKLQKYILFMIARANKHIAIRASGFGVLSMETFAAIMKMSYSYLAMLSQTLK